METQKPVAAKPAAKKEKTMFESLLAIQQGLKTITKNKKGYTGTYADLENIWESIRDLVNGNGFVVFHEVTLVGVKTTALHISGQEKSSIIPFEKWESRISDKGKTTYRDPQEQGKEITYFKRYNLCAIFHIVIVDEDTDAARNLNNYRKTDVDGSLAASKLLAAKTKEQARIIFKSLSEEERNTTAVVAAVEKIKALA